MSNKSKDVDSGLDRASRLLKSVSKRIQSEDHQDIENQKTYCQEITKAKDAVELIRNEKVLQTKEVVVAVQLLQGHCEVLKSALLSRVDDDEDDQEVEKIMQVFTSGRRSLVSQIRLANPGLSKSRPITVDTKVVETTNKAVKKALSGKSGLIIALFLEELDRDPDTRGKITLTSQEYGELTSYYTGSASTSASATPPNKPLHPGAKSRSFFNCLAKGRSIQVLGPVGEKDLWADVHSVKTEGLISTENAIQLAYATPLDVFEKVLDVQGSRIAADRK